MSASNISEKMSRLMGFSEKKGDSYSRNLKKSAGKKAKLYRPKQGNRFYLSLLLETKHGHLLHMKPFVEFLTNFKPYFKNKNKHNRPKELSQTTIPLMSWNQKLDCC